MWFSSLLRYLKSNSTGKHRHTHSTSGRRPTVRPQVETLEDRNLPSFASPVGYAVSQPLALVTADVNGDHKPDLLTLAGNGNYVSVQLNNGNGTFETPRRFYDDLQFATAMTVGDVNRDGKLDIVLANKYTGGGVQQGQDVGSVSVLLGNGHGGFTYAGTSTIFPTTAPISSLVLADLYGDGEMDLVAASGATGSVYVSRPYGNGKFGPAQTDIVPASAKLGGGSLQVAVRDLNGDGKPDLVTVEPGSVSVLLNNGNGTFGTAQTYAVGGDPTALAVGDVSGDGKLDIVTANSNGTVSVLPGLGNGAFGAAQTYAIGGPANSVALGDFNHDGRLDIATTGGTEMDVLLNKGNGTFAAYQKVGPAGSGVVAGDFNGDGYSDLAEIDASKSSVDVLLNNANW
jgi:hypothetical protein